MPSDLGLKRNAGGAHAARTMMLSELSMLLSACHSDADLRDYRRAVVDHNCLGKRSASTRGLTWSHLVELYGLNPDQLVFRALRWFWERDSESHPLLALSAALARDSLLAAAVPHIWSIPYGATATRESLEDFISGKFPGRFSPATLKSVAQNINATLTQSGHLSGRVRKHREHASASPASVAYALLLGYASGARGPELFNTRYMKAQDLPASACMELAEQAARRGWLNFKRIADVIEVDFPQLIRTNEREAIREQA